MEVVISSLLLAFQYACHKKSSISVRIEVKILKELKIGRVLTEHRHQRNITQDELAEYMGVSKASVSKWETGVSHI